MELVRSFLSGKMNKSLDERLVPDGEYIDAMNVRVGSTELSEMGVIENAKGNEQVTTLKYNGASLSSTAMCIGAFDDGIKETIYWFVHSPDDNVDMVVSFNEVSKVLVYHLVGDLNFSKDHLVLGVNKVEDFLFFTDGFNPPRKINVTRSYPSGPALQESDISVIVAPPVKAPRVALVNIEGDSNFLEDKFISFATRFKYVDGEYSALSQFSEIAFEPSFFNFDFSTYHNSGMRNSYNAANVTFDTGGPNVVGIDLVYKTSTSPVLNVIQKYDKRADGIMDNTTISKIFNSKRIFTTLPESELLRTFDNVPLVAKAQTLMGNRIMYGNYKDGNELVDKDGVKVNVRLEASLKDEEFGYVNLDSDQETASYDISGVGISKTNSVTTIDFSGISFKTGGAIGLDLNLTGGLTLITNLLTESFLFELQRDYSSAYDLATSQEFIEAVGALTFHKDVDDCGTPDRGYSLTDKIACSAVAPSGYNKIGFGVNTLGEGIKIIASPGVPEIGFQMIAMVYQNATNPADRLYEYFSITFSYAQYVDVSDSSSLHSNRDFSIGIIYMDEYGRATTVLTSDNNSVHVPAANSILKNTINVKINSKPPYWAKRYKFAVMPSGLDYETIYSTIYFVDPTDGFAYIKLDGDNQNKAKVGDTLIVKSDSNGYLSDLVKCTILEIEAKESDFIEGGQKEPTGLYMKVRASGWAITERTETVKGGETITSAASGSGLFGLSNPEKYPVVAYPLFEEDPDTPGKFNPYSVPEGSIIDFDILFNRPRRSSQTGQRRYSYKKQYIASASYDSVYDFVIAQNIKFDTGESSSTDGEIFNANEFDKTLGGSVPPFTEDINKYQFVNIPLQSGETGSKLALVMVGGTLSRYKTASTINANIKLTRQNGLLVFETEPTESVPGIYFEGDQVFDVIAGEHSDTDIDLTFSDCFTFGNGVESYKINDGLADPYFRLGQRASSVLDQEFKLADRYSSITYSGVYNPETNINKLNEFNLPLGNFKDLERSFGPIQVIYGRQTDVLVLQEDKISYVLIEKNLLSDASAGGAIASIPEVLGTQIARIEEYGISHNPESFAVFGFDKYFTDAKRGAVIRLSGTGSGESIEIISNASMRPWFRDLFIDSFNTRKLGGYDPYMDEYVLTSGSTEIPRPIDTIGCGTPYSVVSGVAGVSKYNVNLGGQVGDSVVSININSITSGQNIVVSVKYNGVTFTSGPIASSTSFTINKNSQSADIAEVTITQSGGTASFDVLVGCVVSQTVTLVNLCVNDKSYEGLVAINETSWNSAYSSSIPVNLLGGDTNPIVAYFNSVSGNQGFGMLPSIGSTVRVLVRPNTFGFNPSIHRLRFLVSNTLYTNPIDILNNTTSLAITAGAGGHYGEFAYSSSLNYIYVVYDYRLIVSQDLCYNSNSAFDACCNCP